LPNPDGRNGTHRGAQIVILLCGGDKRTQQQDIKQALKLAETL
jgi:putative addiction module killer protein